MTEPNIETHPGDFISYAEYEMVVMDFQAADKERRRLARKVVALEREQAVTEDSPEAKEVQALLDEWWREVKNSDPRVAHGLESTRAAKVKSALARRRKVARANKDIADPDREGFEVCRRAILGIRYDEWAMGRIHKSQGKQFNDIAEHILNTDDDIEKWAAMYDRHNPTPEQRDELQARRDQATVERVRQIRQAKDDQADRKHRKEQDRLRVFGDRRPPIDRVLHELPGAEPFGDDRWVTKCPAHDGDNPRSLQITRGDGGTVLLKCWTRGCDLGEIVRSIGLEVRDLWDRSEEDRDAREYRPARERVVPAHLRQQMLMMLNQEKRQAA